MSRVVIHIQGRDGNPYNFIVDSMIPPLRLQEYPSSTHVSRLFLSTTGPSDLVIELLRPKDWLELEGVSRGFNAAIASSTCWLSPLLGGHTLRFDGAATKKSAYVEHLRAEQRVARAWKHLLVFAIGPASSLNVGASLEEIHKAEVRMEVVFPPEVRAWFTLYDGHYRSSCRGHPRQGIIIGEDLLSLNEAVATYDETSISSAMRGYPKLIPLAARNNSWVVATSSGEIFVYQFLSLLKVAKSWSAYLRVQ